MNNILNTILYITSPLLIIGGIVALVGVSSTPNPGFIAIPVILVNGLTPIVAGTIITFQCIIKHNQANEY